MIAARPAMQHDHRDPGGIAALLDIDAVSVTHVQHALVEGDHLPVEGRHCAHFAYGLFHERPI